jgi:hypothetical protein
MQMYLKPKRYNDENNITQITVTYSSAVGTVVFLQLDEDDETACAWLTSKEVDKLILMLAGYRDNKNLRDLEWSD